MSLKGRALCLEPFLSPREERLILSYWASRAPIRSPFFPPGPGDCRRKPKINFPLSVVSGLQRHLQQQILDTWTYLLLLQAKISTFWGCVSKANSHHSYWLIPKEGNKVKSKRHLTRGNGNQPPALWSPNNRDSVKSKSDKIPALMELTIQSVESDIKHSKRQTLFQIVVSTMMKKKAE